MTPCRKRPSDAPDIGGSLAERHYHAAIPPYRHTALPPYPGILSAAPARSVSRWDIPFAWRSASTLTP